MSLLQLHGLVPGETTQLTLPVGHRLLPCGPIGALVSPIANAAMFENPVPEELARWVAHHNSILLAYCASRPVLPMAIGSVFSSTEAVKERVQEDCTAHLQNLAVLKDMLEFTVQLHVTADQTSPAPKVHDGRAFLKARKVQRDRRQNLASDQLQMARNVLQELDSFSVQVTQAKTPKPSRVLDCAVLIRKTYLPQLRQLARTLHLPSTNLGLDLEVSGPWPPYSYDPKPARAGEAVHGH